MRCHRRAGNPKRSDSSFIVCNFRVRRDSNRQWIKGSFLEEKIMSRASRYFIPMGLVLVLAAVVSRTGAHASDKTAAIPAPAVDAQLAPGGVQAVFQHVKGVKSATSGYTGGAASTAHYEILSTGETGHAESV